MTMESESPDRFTQDVETMRSSTPEASSGRLLLSAGIGCVLCLAGLTYLYLNVPLGFHQFKHWSPRPGHSVDVSALYRLTLGLPYQPIGEASFRCWNIVLLVGLFVCYGAALLGARKGLGRRTFLVLTGLMGLIALLIPPFYATDVFYYSITGQITAIYNQNPYFHPPAQFADSVLFPYNYWVDIASPYGPLWTSLSGVLAWVSRAHPFWTPMAFKCLGLLALWTCGALIRRVWHETNPGVTPWGVILFVWNPLVLLDSVANAHMDVVMGCLIVLGALFVLKRKPLYGYSAVLLAVWVKYLPAPLALWSLLARLRPGSTRRLGMCGAYVTVFLASAALVWFPYWRGPKTVFSLVDESLRTLSGPIPFTVRLLASVFSFEPVTIIAGVFITLVVCMVAWGVSALARMIAKGPLYAPQDEVLDWAAISVWCVVVLPGAHPWYIIPALALFAGLYPQAPRRAAWVYGFFSFWFFWRAAVWN
jgi:hypothetical protein